MQWIALDEQCHPITASRAIKHILYKCPECTCPVRLRSGPHRQAHFYHLRRKNTACTQHAKTEEHLRLQLVLANRISSQDEAKIERPFPEIRRIADVTWEKRKIAFEIQCSPISAQEVQRRCADYRSIGWEIVWILSDKRFNRRKLSAAERVLREETSYFSNRKGSIYDQYEMIKGFHRIYKGLPILIDLLLISEYVRSSETCSLPLCVRQRMHSWKLHVIGDVLSHALHSTPWIHSFKALEKRLGSSVKEVPCKHRLGWRILFKLCYLQGFKKILRMLCISEF